MQTKKLIAVGCSDLHISQKQPICRADISWFDVQANYIAQLKSVAGDCPIIVAGDIFDRWNSGAELINFALSHLPNCYAVPGQHDLAAHNYEDIRKTAFWTLVEAGRVQLIQPGTPIHLKDFILHGFPWEHVVKKSKRKSDEIHIAAIHAYIWKGKSTSYPGAKKTAKMTVWKKKVASYDVAIFGDNHKGFLEQLDSTWILNCGGFVRRKSDEKNYKPRIGLIYFDGLQVSVENHFLDTSRDVFCENAIPEEPLQSFEERQFLSQLRSVESEIIDFRELLKRHAKEMDENPQVKALLESFAYGRQRP